MKLFIQAMFGGKVPVPIAQNGLGLVRPGTSGLGTQCGKISPGYVAQTSDGKHMVFPQGVPRGGPGLTDEEDVEVGDVVGDGDGVVAAFTLATKKNMNKIRTDGRVILTFFTKLFVYDVYRPNWVTGAPVNFSMRTRANQTAERRIRPITAQLKVVQADDNALGSEPAVMILTPAKMIINIAPIAMIPGSGLMRFLIRHSIPVIVATLDASTPSIFEPTHDPVHVLEAAYA